MQALQGRSFTYQWPHTYKHLSWFTGLSQRPCTTSVVRKLCIVEIANGSMRFNSVTNLWRPRWLYRGRKPSGSPGVYLGALSRDLVKNHHGVRGELWGEVCGNAPHGDPGGPWSEVSVHHYSASTKQYHGIVHACFTILCVHVVMFLP